MIDPPSRLPVVQELEPEDRMFVHATNPDWGVGLWVGEERTRRRVRFEDGELRVFKKGFYDFLKPVDPDRDDLDEVFASLVDEHESVVAERLAEKARAERPPAMSFDDQVRVFLHQYPKGFEDPAYIDAFRGTEPFDKRQVGEELAMAAATLSRSVLRERIAADDHVGVVDAMRAILARTMLVKPANGHRALAAVDDPAVIRELAIGVYALLYGQDRYRDRFRTWVGVLENALGTTPSWSMATLFPALVFPQEHVAVRRRVFALQALEVRPGSSIPRTVDRRGYRKALRVARVTRDRLVSDGLEPRDLLDVRRFVWDTLRPKALQIRDALKKR